MSVDWALLYRTTYEDLVRFLYRKVWDADLAQETFVRCLREGGARHIDNARAFVFTVAINLARDEARTVVRRKKHLALLANESAMESTLDAEETLERERRIAAVEEAARLEDRRGAAQPALERSD